MDSGDIVNKLLSKAEAAVPMGMGLYGFLQDPMADGRGFGPQNIRFVIDRLTHWKLPSNVIDMYKWALQMPQYSALPNGIMAALAGYVLKELDIHPITNKLGGMFQKGGTAAAIGSLIAATLFLPAVTNSPPNPTLYTGNFAPSVISNFSAAPSIGYPY